MRIPLRSERAGHAEYYHGGVHRVQCWVAA